MKTTENYTRAYNSWTKRLSNVTIEEAKSRLADINEQLSATFESDEYLSTESRNEILQGRKDAIVNHIEKNS